MDGMDRGEGGADFGGIVPDLASCYIGSDPELESRILSRCALEALVVCACDGSSPPTRYEALDHVVDCNELLCRRRSPGNFSKY